MKIIPKIIDNNDDPIEILYIKTSKCSKKIGVVIGRNIYKNI
jgi:hypothetical protein